MPATTPIAVFASGRGSNFEALIRSINEGRLDAEIRVLVSDRTDARALELASAAGIEQLLITPPAEGTREERRRKHEIEILAALKPYKVEYVVLAGYMRILSDVLIEAFRAEDGRCRIVNIHPSLLPAFPGINSYQKAFEYGCKVAGVTVHLVDYGVDQGPICAQQSFEIGDCVSVEQVERLGLELEHQLYTSTLQWVLHNQFTVESIETRSGERRQVVRQS